MPNNDIDAVLISTLGGVPESPGIDPVGIGTRLDALPQEMKRIVERYVLIR